MLATTFKAFLRLAAINFVLTALPFVFVAQRESETATDSPDLAHFINVVVLFCTLGSAITWGLMAGSPFILRHTRCSATVDRLRTTRVVGALMAGAWTIAMGLVDILLVFSVASSIWEGRALFSK
jgi:hypothetical protein